ncbi:MAG: hypothetical protein VB081_07330 [Christensenella sp.]|uniref:hypothetical protein n=1 Tax=Christensenella sp. TaxID=1935934 RepID=UPI002B21C6B4|nr:hypothetical protein [Christensenella sp.]MEA5003296.1 hypothetical protein [Christensenella sp.]
MEFREEHKHEKVGTLKGLLWTLAIVAILFFGMFVVAFLRFWLGISWPQFVLYGAVVVLGFFLIKYQMTDYVYVVQKGKIYFGRKVGAREKELFSVPVRDIAGMGSYAVMKERIAGKKQRKFTFHKKRDAFVLDLGDSAVLLSPTEELKSRLEGEQ